jgi:hypothetical protein
MAVTYAYSTSKPYDAALAEIRRQLYGFSPRMLLFFASPSYDLGSLAWGLKALYPQATSLGCSTAGEIVSGRILSGSVAVMAFDSATIENAAVAFVPNVSSENSIRAAIDRIGDQLGYSSQDVDYKTHFGLVLVDGLSFAEERLMDNLGDLSDVTFVGGSAGDDMRFATTLVCAEGAASSDAAVLAIVKPRVKFDFVKTQSFKVLPKRLVATKVDLARREVKTINGRPAVQEYAAAIGCSVPDLPTRFTRFPLGLVSGGEPFVRSPQRISGNSLYFYGNMVEGMELHLLESTDILGDTKEVVDRVRARGPISAIVNFQSVLRTMELERLGQLESYGRIFAKNPTVGFCTYGEEYIGHVNQTSTLLVLR